MARSDKKVAASLLHFSAGSNIDSYLGALTGHGEEAGRIIAVPLGELVGAAWQPRVLDDADSMQHLMDSIARDGVLHPLTVRRVHSVKGIASGRRYEVVAGHRRLDALRRLADLHHAEAATAPVIIRDLTDLEARLLTHAENAARKDLEAWEKACEIANVRDALADSGAPHDVDSVAVKVGRSGGGVSEYLRIAEVITVDALRAAGACDAGGALDATIVRGMTRAQLFAVVKKDKLARPDALRALVARTRHTPTRVAAARVEAHDTRGTGQVASQQRRPVADLREHGGFRMNLSRPFSRYSASDARRYLAMLAPATVALLEQLDSAGSVTRIPTEAGVLLYVPTPAVGSEEETRAAVLRALEGSDSPRNEVG